MLGFGKANALLETREIERDLSSLLLEAQEGEQVWLISPYVTMDKLSSLKRIISDVAARGVEINFVVRDEPEQITPAQKHLADAIENGLKLYAFQRLHAKVYWFENSACILTSANLVDGSFEASTEVGLGIPAGRLHEEIRSWIGRIIEPGLKQISKIKPKSKQVRKSTPKARVKSGHCIRCGKNIALNPGKPYCAEHFKSWAKYSNSDYEEKFCHSCGKPQKSSLNKPQCYSCFKG